MNNVRVINAAGEQRMNVSASESNQRPLNCRDKRRLRDYLEVSKRDRLQIGERCNKNNIMVVDICNKLSRILGRDGGKIPRQSFLFLATFHFEEFLFLSLSS